MTPIEDLFLRGKTSNVLLIMWTATETEIMGAKYDSSGKPIRSFSSVNLLDEADSNHTARRALTCGLFLIVLIILNVLIVLTGVTFPTLILCLLCGIVAFFYAISKSVTFIRNHDTRLQKRFVEDCAALNSFIPSAATLDKATLDKTMDVLLTEHAKRIFLLSMVEGIISSKVTVAAHSEFEQLLKIAQKFNICKGKSREDYDQQAKKEFSEQFTSIKENGSADSKKPD